MTCEPIEQLEIHNYGCIRKACFRLSPLHALIGPNDSGKSTVLRALRLAAHSATGNFGLEPNANSRLDPTLYVGAETSITLWYAGRVGYRLRANVETQQRAAGTAAGSIELKESVLGNEDEYPHGGKPRATNVSGILHSEKKNATVSPVAERVAPPMLVRFEPNALRMPSRQIVSDEPIQFLDEAGTGLASVYQAINTRDVDAFVAIRDEVRKLFPTIQTILVPTVENNAVALKAKLTDGTLVSASALSEGMLYFLAYAAMRYLTRSVLLLVEEPENGLHPARVSEVISILRAISAQSQVIVATHSPLVVNELRGDEVSVVTRDPQRGTEVVLLKDVPRFEQASKVYQPGEFWLSYADGKQEEPLLTGNPRI